MNDRGKRAVQAKSGCAFPLSRGIARKPVSMQRLKAPGWLETRASGGKEARRTNIKQAAAHPAPGQKTQSKHTLQIM